MFDTPDSIDLAAHAPDLYTHQPLCSICQSALETLSHLWTCSATHAFHTDETGHTFYMFSEFLFFFKHNLKKRLASAIKHLNSHDSSILTTFDTLSI
ncbi:unnamed protein product [Rhizophagus irregularis]|uniref:Uncharacterized protein n=1 Tax=Rhizophagus irregularis TaxID=588596 RepID=A0A916E3B2_9GLOM|nr:unnamed protein product [Rhizophagus irregularis]